MKFKREYSGDPQRFQYATVFIYNTDAKLLLESEFPITVQEMPPEPAQG